MPAGMNPLDDTAFFVRQHYVDFLGREPDAEGLTFWTGDMNNNCPFFPSPCADVKRGERLGRLLPLHRIPADRLLRLSPAQGRRRGRCRACAEFFADTRRAAEGVVVGRAGWEALVEENQRRFADEFVARVEFKERYPETLTPAQYVDALNDNISHLFRENESGALSSPEREQLIQGLAGGTETRASVLRKDGRAPRLCPAGVQPRLRPDAVLRVLEARPRRREGSNFWLSKLNPFSSNSSMPRWSKPSSTRPSTAGASARSDLGRRIDGG